MQYESVLTPDLKGGQEYDGEVGFIEQSPGQSLNILIVAGCSWYFDEMQWMHVPGQSVRL